MAARGAQRRTAIGVATPRFRRSGKILALRSDCRIVECRGGKEAAELPELSLTTRWMEVA